MDPRLRTIRFWLLAALGCVLWLCGCELPLLAAYSLSPLGLFMPVFNSRCALLTCSTSPFAAQYQVVTSGFTNRLCTDCTDRNATWTLTQVTSDLPDLIRGNDCVANYLIQSPCLCVDDDTDGYGDDEVHAIREIRLVVSDNGAFAGGIFVHFRVNILDLGGTNDCHAEPRLGDGDYETLWQTAGGDALDCAALSSYEVPFSARHVYGGTPFPPFYGCLHDGSSAYVTAL